MIDFDAWMKANKLTDQAMAERINVTAGYISRIRRGKVHPNLGTALALHELTQGQVPLTMFLPLSLRPVARRIPPGRPPSKPRKLPERPISRSRASA